MSEDGFRNYRNPSLIERLKKDMHDRIVDGRFAPGERLPSEPELAELFGVSRNSLREAIGLLENEGYLIKRKGIGTFITESDPIIKGGIERLKGIGEFIKEKGYVPGSIVEKLEQIDCGTQLAERLNLEPGEKAIKIETLKTASGKPVASCMDIIPVKFLKGLVEAGALKESIFDYLETRHGITISFAECDLVPSVSDEVLAGKLNVEIGSPLLLLEQIHYDDQGRKVLFSKSFFPASKFAFKLIRKR